MKKRRLLIIAAVIAAAILLLIGVTTAFFTDVEVRENVITIGKVSVELDEGDFEPTETYPVVPGSWVKKAPSVKNTGNKDEFVFMRITVPKDNVTILNEDGTDRGKPKYARAVQQLFRLIANPPEAPAADNVAAVTTDQTGKDLDFSNHSDSAGGTTVDGWVLLERKETDSANDEYVFGYNKKLAPNAQTQTLFDLVQLKSFIDGETTGAKEIGVACYGIQADYLKPDGNVALTSGHLDAAALQAVYSIVKNKANLS